MAFLLASTNPSSTKILLVKSLTGPSSLEWILESSVFGSVGTFVLGVAASVTMSMADTVEEDSEVAASDVVDVVSVVVAASVVVVVVVVGAVVVVVVGAVVVTVVGTLGRMVVVGSGSSVTRVS